MPHPRFDQVLRRLCRLVGILLGFCASAGFWRGSTGREERGLLVFVHHSHFLSRFPVGGFSSNILEVGGQGCSSFCPSSMVGLIRVKMPLAGPEVASSRVSNSPFFGRIKAGTNPPQCTWRQSFPSDHTSIGPLSLHQQAASLAKPSALLLHCICTAKYMLLLDLLLQARSFISSPARFSLPVGADQVQHSILSTKLRPHLPHFQRRKTNNRNRKTGT